MILLFPLDRFHHELDPAWYPEYYESGEFFERKLIRWEKYHSKSTIALGNTRRWVFSRNLRVDPGIYRGWSYSEQEYSRLYQDLMEERNVSLINPPHIFSRLRQLDQWYSYVKHKAPHTEWVHGKDIEGAIQLVEKIGPPCLVRDFRKLRSKEWDTAVFIASVGDAKKVIETFVERQGDSFSGGIAIQKFVELEYGHCEGSPPWAAKEFRMIWFRGELVSVTSTWGLEGEKETIKGPRKFEITLPSHPSSQIFDDVIRSLGSDFVALDVAKTKEGPWLILDVEDPQMMPPNTNRYATALLYQKIHKIEAARPKRSMLGISSR